MTSYKKIPITINDALLNVGMVNSSSGNSHNTDSEVYGGGLVGYDDGLLTGNLPWIFGQTRIYIRLNYNFSAIPDNARIDNASFSLYQTTAYSGGSTVFALYEVDAPWDPSTITWKIFADLCGSEKLSVCCEAVHIFLQR